MNECLTCGEPIVQKKGKRKRLYCSDLCRVRYFQRNGKKKTSKQIAPTQQADPNEAILKQIAIVKAEIIPTHRNTILGRKAWTDEQQKRIIELESKLK